MPIRLLSNITIGTPASATVLSGLSIEAVWVLIQVLRGNSGKIFVGDSTVLNDGLAGVELQTPIIGNTLPFTTLPGPGNTSINLNEIFIHGEIDADGVNVQYLALI